MPHDQAYYEAEKKIEEAQRSGATKLDLNGYRKPDNEKLTELPELLVLGGLTQLQSLNVSGNLLLKLPELLGGLTQLQSLNVSGNRLVELPELLGRLTQLRSLNASNNQLSELPGSLGILSKLENLDVSGNRLSDVPEELSSLENLDLLSLGSAASYPGGNPITELPICIRHLKMFDIFISQFFRTHHYSRLDRRTTKP